MRNFKHALEADIALEERLLIQYENELRRLPRGWLEESNSGRVVHYIDDNGTEHGTKKTSRIASGLSRRKLLEKKTAILQENLKRQKKLLSKYEPYTDSNIVPMLKKVYQKILRSEEMRKKASWVTDYGFGSTQMQDGTAHKSMEGIDMDSKSEVIISMLLETYGVQYIRGMAIVWPDHMPEEARKSKALLQLPDMVVPDFVFILPSGEKIYWEHLGMLGEKKYSLRWMKKQVFYHWLGITQGVNLIVTADDCNGAIDPAVIAEIIETKLAPLITKPRRH